MTDDLHMQRTAAKHYTLCQISGFHCSIVEAFAFPGLYAALVGGSLLMFQDSLSVLFTKIKQSTKNARTGESIVFIGYGVGTGCISWKANELILMVK
jgi:hypothetical protein